MFRRRKSLSLLTRVRTVVWPTRGFGRLFSYLAQRVMRMPGSSASIAVGLACGVAVSFTPFLGFHLLLGAMLAYLMRGNMIASGIGTIVGNPWTFPFIWVWIYQLGIWMGVGGLQNNMAELEFTALFGNIFSTVLALDMNYLLEVAWPVIGPMLAGAIPTALASWLMFYFLSAFALKSVHRRSLERKG